MRRAVDTNVLVRILADDGSEQVASARALLQHGTVVVVPTVLLETEWVLRSRYGYSSAGINVLLSALLGMPNVEILSQTSVRQAIVDHGSGLDFADALHLNLAADCDEFLTFDRSLLRKAHQAAKMPGVREP